MEKPNSLRSRPSLEDDVVTGDKQAESIAPSADTPAIGVLTIAPIDVPEGEWEYVTGFKLAVVIGAVTVICFLMLLDTAIVATAIPRITSDFHSLGDIGWYGSAYLLANCALQPMAGKIYNRYSSKYSFMVFLGIFELGSLLCGIAISSKMLIIARAISGMGASGLVNGALTIIAASVPLEKRATYLGVMMGVSQLGILLGPLLGGALTQYTTWRWCFYINLPIGGLAMIMLLLIHVPDRRAKSQKELSFKDTLQSFDLPGFLLFAPTAVMFLLALEWGGTTYKWNSATVIGLFCGAAATAVLFLLWEKRVGDAAMIPLSILKQRIVWSSCLNFLFIAGNMLTTGYYLAIYFQAVRGASPTLSGVYTLPGILSQMCMAVTSGIFVGRLGYYLPWAVACGILMSVGTGLLSSLKPNTHTVQWIFYQIIAGAGRGCGLQMSIIAIQSILKQELQSVGMSTLVFCQGFGGALFLSFAQTTLSSGIRSGLAKFAPEVDAGAVINAGAAGIRGLVPAGSLPGVLEAYDQAVNHVFYLITGAAAAVFLSALGMGWKSVKKAKAVVPEV